MRPPHGGLVLFPRPLSRAVNNHARFRKGFCSRRAWHRRCKAQPILVVYRHDKTGLAGEVEPVEIVSLGLEDHGSRSHAALNSAIAASRLAA